MDDFNSQNKNSRRSYYCHSFIGPLQKHFEAILVSPGLLKTVCSALLSIFSLHILYHLVLFDLPFRPKSRFCLNPLEEIHKFVCTMSILSFIISTSICSVLIKSQFLNCTLLLCKWTIVRVVSHDFCPNDTKFILLLKIGCFCCTASPNRPSTFSGVSFKIESLLSLCVFYLQEKFASRPKQHWPCFVSIFQFTFT